MSYGSVLVCLFRKVRGDDVTDTCAVRGIIGTNDRIVMGILGTESGESVLPRHLCLPTTVYLSDWSKLCNMPCQQYRRWMYTCFGSEPNPLSWSDCKYAVHQLEVAPETGREHYQGYAWFGKPKSLRAVKMFDGGNNYHWEACHGNHKECVEYCTKERTRKEGSNYREFGIPPAPGKRNDVLDVVDAMSEGSSLKQLCEDYPVQMIKYYKGIQYVKMMVTPPRSWPMDVTVLFGPTECGKSYLADLMLPGAYRVMNSSDSKGKIWFEGYAGEESVIMEEMEGYRCTYSWLKEFLDRYPFKVESKGGSHEFAGKKIVITSNTPPSQWYTENANRKYAPLERRLNNILEFVGFKRCVIWKGSVSLPDGYEYRRAESWESYAAPVGSDVCDRGSNGRSVNWVDPVVDRNPQTGKRLRATPNK